MASLKERYNQEIAPALAKELAVKNPMEVPLPKKIVVNMGLGAAKKDANIMTEAEKELTQITGQKANVRRSRRSEAGWGLRRGEAIGLAVTLRGVRMWGFLEKFVTVALPRVRDFRGVSLKSFDGHGNLTVGVEEHTIFPEINPNVVSTPKGLEVVIVTSAGDDARGYQLLKALGMPFSKTEVED